MTPAPNVGFNLTYVCPEEQVFEHDWFATPFVMMTCQVKTMHKITHHKDIHFNFIDKYITVDILISRLNLVKSAIFQK